jgi:hypothetical protein
MVTISDSEIAAKYVVKKVINTRLLRLSFRKDLTGRKDIIMRKKVLYSNGKVLLKSMLRKLLINLSILVDEVI